MWSTESELWVCVESRGLYNRVAQSLLRRLYAVKARHPLLDTFALPLSPYSPSCPFPPRVSFTLWPHVFRAFYCLEVEEQLYTTGLWLTVWGEFGGNPKIGILNDPIYFFYNKIIWNSKKKINIQINISYYFKKIIKSINLQI